MSLTHNYALWRPCLRQEIKTFPLKKCCRREKKMHKLMRWMKIYSNLTLLTNKWISCMLWSETCCQGVRNHVWGWCCCCFFHLYCMFSAAWSLQITVHCIFSASCLSFQSRKCHPSWQTRYSLINNASLFPFLFLTAEKKNLCVVLFSDFLILHALWKTQESRDGGQVPLTLLEGICSRWTTMALRPLWGHGGVVSVLEMGGLIHGQPHLQSPSLKESKQPAGAITWHISIQFPLQNVFIFRLMACHFAGAFGQELILESKQIFRGAIFHQVLIFLHSRSLYSLI